MGEIKAVMFDLDNTLVYTSLDYIVCTFKSTVKELSDRAVSKEDAEKFWFDSGRSAFIRNLGLNSRRFWHIFVTKYHTIENLRGNAFVYEDVRCLNRLRPKVKFGVVTSAIESVAEYEFNLVKEQVPMDVLVVANVYTANKLRGKPHPDGIHECLKQLGVSNNEAIFVGDNEGDILAARRAGVYNVLIERREYKGIEPSKRIKSLEEISEILLK